MKAAGSDGGLPRGLPDDLQSRAIRTSGGEYAWPVDDAVRVIAALADAGSTVLGLDLERRQPDGGYAEEPLYVSGPDTAQREAAHWALHALREEARDGDLVIITWA